MWEQMTVPDRVPASFPTTLIDKLWNAHAITTRADGQSLLFIDRHLLHEGSFHSFEQVRQRGARLARPDLTFGIADHYVATRPASSVNAPAAAGMVAQLARNAAEFGFLSAGAADPRQGIVHVALPEQGLTLPGLSLVCGDSHTSTHGAFGAFAFGIGASEVAHVLMTQTLWQKRPRRMRIRVEGTLGAGIGAKDIALSIIAKIGADGAQGHAIEYAGSAVRALSMEGRMTLCNLAIEAGGRLGVIAPDETTFAFLRGRRFAPKGEMFERAVADWRHLVSDDDAVFDREVMLQAAEIAPTVTWGTSPEQAGPITGIVPDPETIADPNKAQAAREAIGYMGLHPGQAMTDIRIDRIFIGSCTNSRIEDLRAAAAILVGRTARVPGLVSPGSAVIKQQAEAEGLDRVFREAGLEWADPGCSMCVGMNGDTVASGERCASTTNRNFKGRQGRGSRTHLMSPSMAAAAAVAGRLVDARSFQVG
jgi:3-isopropylmalate/(R)-2-methylmalate dehydratase large subunit